MQNEENKECCISKCNYNRVEKTPKISYFKLTTVNSNKPELLQITQNLNVIWMISFKILGKNSI